MKNWLKSLQAAIFPPLPSRERAGVRVDGWGRALALYLGLTVVIAWPSVTQPARWLFGFHGDTLLTVFWLWWFKTAWLTGQPFDPNPMAAAPFGAEWGQVIERGTVWPGLLLSHWVNETFASNVLTLISFPLAGLAVYGLALRLCGDRRASLIAGLIYAFCPYHLWKAWAWIPLANIQFLPLYLWALLELRQEQRLRHALLAGLWFGLNFLTSYIYGFIACALTVIYGLYWLIYAYVSPPRPPLAPPITCYGGGRGGLLALAGLAVAAALILPVALPILNATRGSQATAYKSAWPFSDLYALTASTRDYFLPCGYNAIKIAWPEACPSAEGRGGFTHGLFIGYIPLCLAGVALWRSRRRTVVSRQWSVDSNQWTGDSGQGTVVSSQGTGNGGQGSIVQPDDLQRFAIPFLVVLFISALLLSIWPPTLELTLPGGAAFTLKGPGYFTYAFAPWFREYARFGVLVMLAVALLAACGVATQPPPSPPHFLRKWGGSKGGALLGLLLVGLALDYGYLRLPQSSPLDTANVPPVYRWLAKQPGDAIIAEYPYPRSSQVSPNYLYYVSVHGKRLVNGNGFSYRADLLSPALWDLSDRQAAGALRALGVEYVLLHSSFPGMERWYAGPPLSPPISAENGGGRGGTGPPFELVETFETTRLLRPRGDPATVIVAPGLGMNLAPDQQLQTAWWWLSEWGELNLVNLTEGNLTVEVVFTLTGYGQAQGLDAYLPDGSPLSIRAQAGSRAVLGPLTLPPSHIFSRQQPDVVTLALHAPGGGEGSGVGLRDFEIVVMKADKEHP